MCRVHDSEYSEEDCSSCEYNVAIKTLKAIIDFKCACCAKGVYRGGFGCANGDQCDNYKDFILDWDKVFKEYGINQENTNAQNT